MPNQDNIHFLHVDEQAPLNQGIHIWLTLLCDQEDIFQGNTSLTSFLYHGQPYTAATSFSQEECLQLQSFKSHKAASLFATSHLMLRFALKKWLPHLPFTRAFVIDQKGKPHVNSKDNSKNVQFSISHTWPVAGVALTTHKACGLDVEMCHSGKGWQDLTKNCLQVHEIEHIRSSPNPQSAFIQCWTRKEAAAKALGLGLHWDFTTFSICPTTNTVLCPQKKQRIHVRSVHLSKLWNSLDGWLSIACPIEQEALPPVYVYLHSPVGKEA